MSLKYIRIYKYLWIIYGFLTFIGIVEVFSAGSKIGILHGIFYGPGLEHLIYVLAGFFIMLITVSTRDILLKYSYKFADIFMFITLGIILITVIIGPKTNEARRTLTIPIINKSINTFELLKLAVVFFVAKNLSHNRKHTEVFVSNLKKIGILTGIGLFLVATQNLSTGIIIYITVLSMLFFAKIPQYLMKEILKIVGIATLIGIIFFLAMPSGSGRKGTWEHRIKKFVKGQYEQTDQGYITQASIAHTSIIHLGPGKSEFKYILPLAHTDYIFAITGEELAPVALLLPFFYLALFYFGILITLNQKKPYYMFLAAGFSLMITLQAFIHILVNLGLMPETGQPLPFISKGGMAVLTNSIMMGFLLAIHREAIETKKQNEPGVEEPEEFDIIDIDDDFYQENTDSDFQNPIFL